MNTITLLSISVLLFYSLIQILKFYNIGPDIYGIYLYFYVFMIISLLILPNQYPK